MRSNVQLCDATTSNQKQLTSITSNQARQGMDSSTWIPKLLQTVSPTMVSRTSNRMKFNLPIDFHSEVSYN